MTPEDGPISIPPHLRVEEYFVSLLTADTTLTGLDIVAGSNRDALVPPLHCFVLCRNVEPLLSVGQNYFADVIIGIAGNIDDTNHTVRKSWTTLVLAALTRCEPGNYVDAPTGTNIRVLGWSVKSIEEASEGQNIGDLVRLRVAAWIAG